ncbi:hypothetical protein BJ166DRAFT_7590 [Pestalotiopsis sp. NC0098]|nr:hypothetical protein BJ166DRAFT_7590 [Pestalotiopsis sp. NC0098]
MSFEAKHFHHLEQSPTCLQLDPAAVLFRAGSEKNAASPRPSTKLQPVYAARLRVRFVSVANKACSAAQPGLGIGVTMEAHTRYQLKPHACHRPLTALLFLPTTIQSATTPLSIGHPSPWISFVAIFTQYDSGVAAWCTTDQVLKLSGELSLSKGCDESLSTRLPCRSALVDRHPVGTAYLDTCKGAPSATPPCSACGGA